MVGISAVDSLTASRHSGSGKRFQTDLDADCEVANTLAWLIVDGWLLIDVRVKSNEVAVD